MDDRAAFPPEPDSASPSDLVFSGEQPEGFIELRFSWELKLNWVLALFLVVVLAWGMWLLFCYAITKAHGVEALKAAPPIAKAFPVTEWISGLKAVGPWVMEWISRSNPPPPAVGPPPPPTSDIAGP